MNQPRTTAVDEVFIQDEEAGDVDSEDLDVTALFQAMHRSPSANKGLMLRLQDESPYAALIFGSSDAPDPLRPRLVLGIRKQEARENGCENGGFEDRFSNWSFGANDLGASDPLDPTAPLPNGHVLISSPGWDPNLGPGTLSVLDPSGSATSLRLGHPNVADGTKSASYLVWTRLPGINAPAGHHHP